MNIIATTATAFPFAKYTYYYSPPSSGVPLRNRLRFVGCVRASVSSTSQGASDPELRLVLELATDCELFELEDILFGPSYFSPLIKSITSKTDVDYAMIDKDLQERENFIEALESRFLFLAADARSTLRGWRPSYRNVLLSVRKELSIPCSNKLSTADLEAEIFLHLLQDYASEEYDDSQGSTSNDGGGLELGLNAWKPWKVQARSSLKEFQTMVLKGGGIVTVAKVFQLLLRKLSGKVFLEGANYQIRKELLKKGGQIAAVNLESRAALLAARQGLAGAASRYVGFRSAMALLGPVLWGTFLADVVIQMLGTDYARILRAIYAFAQIRIIRTYDFPSSSSDDDWGV